MWYSGSTGKLLGGAVATVALLAVACSSGVAQEEYDALASELQTKTSSLTEAQSLLQAKESELTQLQSTKQTIDGQLAAAAVELANLQSSGQASASELQAKEADLAQLQTQLALVNSQVTALQAAIPEPEPLFGIALETFDASGPAAYTAAPGSTLAYIQTGMTYGSPADANYLTVVDVASKEILAQVAIPMPDGYKSHGLAMSADGKFIYVPSLTGGSTLLYVLDGRTLKVVQTLDVGGTTHHVDEGTYKSNDRLILVDTGNPEIGIIALDPSKDNEVVGVIPWHVVGGRPYSGWSSPDGSFAYVTVRPRISSEKGWISKVDLTTFKEIQAIQTGVGPVWVAFAADGKTAWVSNASEGTVSQIAIAESEEEQDRVVAIVDLDAVQIYGLVLSNDGTKLYAAKKYTSDAEGTRIPGTTIVVLDTLTKQVIKEIPVGAQPDHLFLSPDGTEVWVGENRGYGVSIINTETDEVTDFIELPGDAHTVRFQQF